MAESTENTQTTQISLGVDTRCSDGPCGTVIRVVVDPVARTVTHVVVEPRHREGFGRLVPLDLVEARADEVTLGCTTEQFEQLELAEETTFLPNDPSYLASGEVYAVPLLGVGTPNVPPPITTDVLPLGEVGCAATSRCTPPTARSAGCAASYRPRHPPPDPRAPPGGSSVGTQAGGDPHRRGDRDRVRHPPRHDQAGGAGPPPSTCTGVVGSWARPGGAGSGSRCGRRSRRSSTGRPRAPRGAARRGPRSG